MRTTSRFPGRLHRGQQKCDQHADDRDHNEQLDKVKTKFDQLDRQFDELVGTRRRQLEKPLQELEAVRRERNLPIDGEMFPEAELEPGDETPANVRRLGA